MRPAVLLLLAACVAPRAGVQRANYADGKPHFEYEVRDGVPNGTGRVWYPNGELKSEGPYVNGFKHGRFRFYTETGDFEKQVLFWKDADVWSSTSPGAQPSEDLEHGLEAYAGTELKRTLPEPEERPLHAFELSSDPTPAPYFATLDRATPLSRFGIAISAGTLSRMEVFGNYLIDQHYGVYGDLQQANLATTGDMTISGRRTIEVGGSRTFELANIGTLTPHAGLLAPVGNDNENGYIASSANALIRPSDAAASFPSSAALRTGATFIRRGRYVVVQGDGGLDWIAGGDARPLDALVRGDVGVGLGLRAGIIGLELSNSLRVSDPSRSVEAAAISGTFWFAGAWLTAALSHGFSGSNSLGLAVGYEL